MSAGSPQNADACAAAGPAGGEEKRQPFIMRWLTTLTVLGCLVGVATGILCRELNAPEEVKKVVQLPGELFIRALKVVVVPMVFASMVSNAASLGETGGTNKMASMAVKYYLSTTFVAALEGVVLFNVFLRGSDAISTAVAPGSTASPAPSGASLDVLDTVIDFSKELVPDNIFRALLEMQLLSVITFAVFFGLVLARLPSGGPVIQFFTTCFDAMVEMIRRIIIFTPFGVASLVSRSVAQSHDLGSAMGSIGKFFCVAILGLLLHAFGVYSLIYASFTRKNPFRYFARMVNMWTMAFGTSSSAATLATTCKTCEGCGIARRTVQFVCTIGCTINMDGSALRMPIAVLWIAHTASQSLPIHKQLVVAFIAALMSVGGSPIPSAGVSTLMLMVEAAGVTITPTVQLLVGFCLAIEWLLDSCSTAVNVTGDAIGVAVIDHLLGGKGDKCGEVDDEAAEEAQQKSSCEGDARSLGSNPAQELPVVQAV